MKFSTITKYILRFLLLDVILTIFTIWYFDKYLIGDYQRGFEIIINNLYEDRLRFYSFIPKSFVTIDSYLAIFIFLFLIVLYSTNFYSYNNDLVVTTRNKLFDEFFPIYLVWTSSLLSFLQIFRFNAVSRGFLLGLTIIIPFILIIFRNTESISRILGRNSSNENYVSFNLPENSIFKELRLLKVRNSIKSYKNIQSIDHIKDLIESENKTRQINLIVIFLNKQIKLNRDFEVYLLKLNKKILLISDEEIKFDSNFLYRKELLSDSHLHFINNDIQYGSKYIIKRFLDISITIFLLPILFSLITLVGFYILFKDGYPFIIKQKRIGLHGEEFSMYKLRTMKKSSHFLRKDLKDKNQKGGPLFKISNDPRLYDGAKWIRKLSLDELPQFINVLKGDMSIVGPRPLFPEDNQYFDQNYLRRLNVLPGITGLLQINDRNTSDFDIWFKYDLEYIENWNIVLDLKIILKTPMSLFKIRSQGE